MPSREGARIGGPGTGTGTGKGEAGRNTCTPLGNARETREWDRIFGSKTVGVGPAACLSFLSLGGW